METIQAQAVRTGRVLCEPKHTGQARTVIAHRSVLDPDTAKERICVGVYPAPGTQPAEIEYFEFDPEAPIRVDEPTGKGLGRE